jgi:lipopolysaccharide/colanic/teichoic acid biosynthesis glycosyltransferase
MFKRVFDFLFSIVCLFALIGIIFILWILATIDTRSNGFFFQVRIGQFGKPFLIFKLKTIQPKTNAISAIGFFLRKSKLDELPQLFNVLIGQMSFVGPRPDVPGYADMLKGVNRQILLFKPGITSLASLKYRNEDDLLSKVPHPLLYNDTIIYPDKVRLNLWYVQNYSWCLDLRILYCTLVGKTFWE